MASFVRVPEARKPCEIPCGRQNDGQRFTARLRRRHMARLACKCFVSGGPKTYSASHDGSSVNSFLPMDPR